MRLPPLNAIRAFEAAARHLSFKLAAEELFVTPAAVSYQIKTLEEFLGVDLFIRENRAILLTAAGQRCLQDVKTGFEHLARGMEKAKAEQRKGAFVVSAGPAFTVKWLAPRLQDFVNAHPDIDARVAASLGFLDLRHDAVDAAIRFGNADAEGLAVQPLIEESVVPMCHPSLLENNALSTPADLANCTLIHDDSLNFAPQSPNWENLLARYQLDSTIDPKRGLRFNQADHALQAAMDGSGIVLGRRVLATPDLQAGRLVTPFPQWEQPANMRYYFVCLEERAQQYKIDAFRTWITQLLNS